MLPTQLKDTYRILPPQYEYLSPLHGTILFESGTIKNMYEASLAYPRPENKWLANIDGPLRLTQSLFTNTGAFDVSHNPNYPARHLSVSTLGEIIMMLEENPQSLDAHALEDFILRDTEFSQSMCLINAERKSVKSLYESHIKQFPTLPHLSYSYNFVINKIKMQRLCRDWLRVQQMNIIKARLEHISHLKGKEQNHAQKEQTKLEKQLEELQSGQTGGDYNRVLEFAQSLLDSFYNPDPYPRHIAQWILLSVMCRKAKTKTDLVPYFSFLRKKLGAAACGTADESWVKELYTTNGCDTTLQGISLTPESYSHILESGAYESIAYKQIVERFYKGPSPKVPKYADIVIHGTVFPDCVESTIFTLCNMTMYNKETGTFELNRIQPDYQSHILTDFYTNKEHKQATNIDLQNVHQDWGVLMQNLPLVTYRQQIIQTSNGPLVISAPKDIKGTICNGFIYGIPDTIRASLEQDGDHVKIAGRWYIHTHESSGYLCEMHPTLRNVIIVLNQLFNLNIFSKVPIEEAFLSEHFNATYLPLLCEKFAILNHKKWPDYMLAEFDEKEYTDKGLHISFNYFDLILTDEHAEIITSLPGNSDTDIGPALIRMSLASKNIDQKWALAQLASLFPFDVSHIPAHNSYPYIFLLPLYHNTVKINAAVFCIRTLCDPKISGAERLRFTHLALSFMQTLPERLDWHYHTELIDKLEPHELEYPVVKQEINRIMHIAQEKLSGSVADIEYVPALYLSLMCKNQQCEKIMTVLDKLLSKKEAFDRRPLLNLLIKLTEQGQALPQAQLCVDMCLHTSVEAERTLAQSLLENIQRQCLKRQDIHESNRTDCACNT